MEHTQQQLQEAREYAESISSYYAVQEGLVKAYLAGRSACSRESSLGEQEPIGWVQEGFEKRINSSFINNDYYGQLAPAMTKGMVPVTLCTHPVKGEQPMSYDDIVEAARADANAHYPGEDLESKNRWIGNYHGYYRAMATAVLKGEQGESKDPAGLRFADCIPYLLGHRRIRQTGWPKGDYLQIAYYFNIERPPVYKYYDGTTDMKPFVFDRYHFINPDWEVCPLPIPEPKQ
jgi:hypothetical protein